MYIIIRARCLKTALVYINIIRHRLFGTTDDYTILTTILY